MSERIGIEPQIAPRAVDSDPTDRAVADMASGPSAELITLGCRLNASESETMRAMARQVGLGNAVIVNSCAVTGEAVRQTRQAIRRARRDNPAARILVTGCAAQIDPASFAAMPEVDAVIGNDEKMRAESWRAHSLDEAPRVAVGDIMTVRETAAHLAAGFQAETGRVRAFLEVQQGCDHRCTFCIIPFGRGNNRSAAAGDIVARARALVEAGVQELVLTGVDITGWGGDLPGNPSLGQLARRILSLVPDLRRLRLSSIDVAEVDAELWRLIAEEPRLMPHLHLSLQAGSDMILKRMKRRHTRKQAVEFCERARALRPEIAFGADLIAGFPTETDAMHRESVALIEDCDIAFAHVFPFSSRAGTPAARMPQLPKPLRKERAAALRVAGAARRRTRFDALVGRSVTMLVEECADTIARGHSDCFAPAEIAGPFAPGAIVARRIARHDGNRLILTA
jgi:threonylcarbamoyladenosine tRNA methylthiotransferase MtaB